MIFYLQTETGAYAIDAKSAGDAKHKYREAFGLKKMPSGSVISTDKRCGFFTADEFKHLNF